VFSPVAGQILNIAGGVANGVNVVKSAFAKMTAIFQNFQDKAAKFGSDIINSFANGIKSAINTVINAVQKLINTMSSLWNTAERDASSAGSRTAQAYIQSYNSTTSMSRLANPTILNPRSSINGSTTNSITNNNNMLVSAIQTLTDSVNSLNKSTNVNVELVGSAKNIFDTVRVQNNIMQTATGYHALA